MLPQCCYIKCKQYGPIKYYFGTCFEEQHKRVNLFHVAEKWKVCYVTWVLLQSNNRFTLEIKV